jgi:hypothetical protein
MKMTPKDLAYQFANEAVVHTDNLRQTIMAMTAPNYPAAEQVRDVLTLVLQKARLNRGLNGQATELSVMRGVLQRVRRELRRGEEVYYRPTPDSEHHHADRITDIKMEGVPRVLKVRIMSTGRWRKVTDAALLSTEWE